MNLPINQEVKCYFKDQTRVPIIGKFVAMHDANYLTQKGMIRFVTESQRENFEREPKSMFTRIFNINSFSNVKIIQLAH